MKNADGIYVKPSIDAFYSTGQQRLSATGFSNKRSRRSGPGNRWPITMGTLVVFEGHAGEPRPDGPGPGWFISVVVLTGDTL